MEEVKFEVLERIRPAEKGDLSAILEMMGALAEHHGDVATASRDTLARDILGPTPWVRILVAEHNGVCVGYAALCPLSKLQFGRRGMDLQHLFVMPEVRNIGVGKALIEASKALAQGEGCSFLTVGTHPDNTVVHAIYPAMGFVELDAPGPRFRITFDPVA